MSNITKHRYTISESTWLSACSHRALGYARALMCYSALAFPGLAVAQAWVVTPELNIQSGYVNNINLTAEDAELGGREIKENSGIETNASVAATLARKTPISELSAKARVDFISYTQEEEEDVDNEDNQYVDVIGRYKLTPINDVGLRARLERKFTGTTTRDFGDRPADVSLEDAGNDNLSDVDTDTGVSRVQVRRERILAEPYWSIGLTQSTRLRLQYRYDDTAYGSGAVDARLVDFTRQRGSVRLEHNLTERSRVFFSIDGGKYEADAGRESDEIAARTGYRFNFSPISVVGINVGARQLTFDNLVTGEEEDDVGAIVRVFGEHRGELTRYTASIGRTITPSGNGALVESDIVDFNFTRSISPRFDFHFESEYFGNTAVGDNADPRSDRDYVRVSPMLRWNWTPEWSVNLIYRYEWEDRELNSLAGFGDAESHSAFISIIYRRDTEI